MAREIADGRIPLAETSILPPPIPECLRELVPFAPLRANFEPNGYLDRRFQDEALHAAAMAAPDPVESAIGYLAAAIHSQIVDSSVFGQHIRTFLRECPRVVLEPSTAHLPLVGSASSGPWEGCDAHRTPLQISLLLFAVSNQSVVNGLPRGAIVPHMGARIPGFTVLFEAVDELSVYGSQLHSTVISVATEEELRVELDLAIEATLIAEPQSYLAMVLRRWPDGDERENRRITVALRNAFNILRHRLSIMGRHAWTNAETEFEFNMAQHRSWNEGLTDEDEDVE